MPKRGPYNQFLAPDAPNSYMARTSVRAKRMKLQRQQNQLENVEPNRTDDNFVNENQNGIHENGGEVLFDNIREEAECSFDSSADEDVNCSFNESVGAQPTDTEKTSTKPLYDGSPINTTMAILLINSFCIEYQLTKQAIQDLLDLFKLILPSKNNLPVSTYLLSKQFTVPNILPIYHCPKCLKELTRSSKKATQHHEQTNCPANIYCSDCSKDFEEKHLRENGFYHCQLDLKYQLQILLEDGKLGECIDFNAEVGRRNPIEDVKQGKLYVDFKMGKGARPYSLSLVMNTDGAPIFNSSNTAIWPVFFKLNELPKEIRDKYLLLGALFYGRTQPAMKAFLARTVAQLQDLSINGFNWQLKDKRVNSTVDVIMLCADSVARCKLQNMIQFNGVNGCSWCLTKGKRYFISETSSIQVYPHENRLQLRTRATFQNSAVIGSVKKPHLGVKGPSILSDVPGLDLAFGVIYDGMHGLDLGVFRQLADLWFEPSNHKAPWYVGKRKMKELDESLLNISPTSNTVRLPRILTTRKYWKASEWHNLFIHYGPVLLKNVLPARYYKNYLLLSDASFIFIQDSITSLELAKAEELIIAFSREFEIIYGERHMSFNIHQLRHAADCVSRWGPLWAYSAYAFEDHNGKLLNFFNGTQAAEKQIIKNFLKKMKLRAAARKLEYTNNTDFEQEAFSHLLSRIIGLIPSFSKKDDCGVDCFGYQGEVELSDRDRNMIRAAIPEDNWHFDSKAKTFDKVRHNRILMAHQGIGLNSRRRDCFVKDKDDRFVVIEKILLLTDINYGTSTVVLKVKTLNVVEASESAIKGRVVQVRSDGRLCELYKICAITSVQAKCHQITSKPLVLSVVSHMSQISK